MREELADTTEDHEHPDGQIDHATVRGKHCVINLIEAAYERLNLQNIGEIHRDDWFKALEGKNEIRRHRDTMSKVWD